MKEAEKERNLIPMETASPAYIKTIVKMVKGNLFMKRTKPVTKVILLTIAKLGKVFLFVRTSSMWVTGSMDPKKVTADLNTPMEKCMRENSKILNHMERASCCTRMVVNMLENLLLVKGMAMVPLSPIRPC